MRIPNILDRADNQVTFTFRKSPSILGYQVNAANSLDNAYGPANGVGGAGTVTLFNFRRDQFYRSREIRKKRLGILGESNRGLARCTFDPQEFYQPGTVTPIDRQLAFYRFQFEKTANPGVYGPEDQIIMVPPPGFYSVPRPAISLYGTAPNIAGATPGLIPPPGCMVFNTPSFADSMVIENLGITPLLFSVGLDIPLQELSAGQILSHTSGMKDEIVICADGANPTFSILVAIVTGLR